MVAIFKHYFGEQYSKILLYYLTDDPAVCIDTRLVMVQCALKTDILPVPRQANDST